MELLQNADMVINLTFLLLGRYSQKIEAGANILCMIAAFKLYQISDNLCVSQVQSPKLHLITAPFLH
jgi:hypothetical protein